MARPRIPNPKYRVHKSGNARVRLVGQDYYLGLSGTAASHAKYHALLATYNANGQSIPETVPCNQCETPITLSAVTANYAALELTRYESNPGSHCRISGCLRLMDSMFGSTPADEFGPVKLRAIRTKLIEKGNSRRYINDQVRDIIGIMRHAVSLELVSPATITALETLRSLRKGEASDPPPRTGVSIQQVKNTLPYLSEVVADMVRLQLGTGCRPSELFSMTPAQVDTSGEDWIYTPLSHKTSAKGKSRSIPIVGTDREILSPYLQGPEDQLCFRTCKDTSWNKDSYRRHITRAAKRAGVEHWTPYQLRHTACQVVRDAHGIEAASALLGHARLPTTEIYSSAATKLGIKAAKAAPKL